MCHKELFKENVLMATLKSLAVSLLVTEMFVAVAGTLEKPNTIEFDYAHCKVNRQGSTQECAAEVTTEGCYCYVEFTLDRAMPGPVRLYYRLPDFNQTRASYANSLDKEQLNGTLSMNVSPSCGDFSYDADKRPIAPCGEIADSYFFDQFSLFVKTSSPKEVPNTGTDLDGVEKEKENYHNPSGDLKTVFQNFSKPKSWSTDVTGLDKYNPENNGFQHERFIAWMKTDLRTKPAMRFYNTGMEGDGLAAGDYFLRIRYYHSKYITGPRIVLISSERLATKELEEAERLARTTASTHLNLTNVPTRYGGNSEAGSMETTTQPSSILDSTTTMSTITSPGTSSKRPVPITENHTSTEPSSSRRQNPVPNDRNNTTTMSTITSPGTSSKRPVPITENQTSTEPSSSRGRGRNLLPDDKNNASYSTEPTTVTTKSNHIVVPTPVLNTEKVLPEPVIRDPRRPNPITDNGSTINCDMPTWALVIIYTAVAVAIVSVIIYIALPKLKIFNIDMFIW